MASSNIKIFLSVFLTITVLALVFVKNSYAAPISAEFVGKPIVTDGKIEFDFKVNNPDADRSWGIYVQTSEFLNLGVHCTITPAFNADINDVNNSFGKVVRASCDMGGFTSGDYPFQILNDGVEWANTVLATKTIPYPYGSPDLGKLTVSSDRQEDGKFEFTVTSGSRIQAIAANFVVEGYTPSWAGGTKYNCPGVSFSGWYQSVTKSVVCDLSGIAPGTHNVYLVKDQDESNHLATTTITISDVELTGSTNVGNPTNRNLFNINAARYSNAAATSFKLKVKDGGGYLDTPVYSRTFSSVGPFVFGALDYNSLPSGTWEIQLFDAADKPYNSVSITIEKTILTNTCQCEVTTPTNSCSTNPTLFVNRQSCILPTIATPLCVNPVLGSEATCSCTCVGTPMDSPDVPGGPISPDYDVTDLESLFKTLQNVIIGIAVFSGVFIIPYAFVLMASGNPEKIKHGTEWLKSIFWGYLVIFLAGTLIRIVGGEILSFGF